MTDLLPCPFCGGAAEQTDSGAVMCGNTECITICGVPSNGFRNDHDPVALWNTRAPAQAALGSCTQAELDTWEKHLDSKDAQLLLMWVDRALKAEAALALPSTHQRETYCALCDREHQLHEDAQGFHHVIKGERVACPVSPADRHTEAEGRK